MMFSILSVESVASRGSAGFVPGVGGTPRLTLTEGRNKSETKAKRYLVARDTYLGARDNEDSTGAHFSL
jgi:hypothetical protein